MTIITTLSSTEKQKEAEANLSPLVKDGVDCEVGPSNDTTDDVRAITRRAARLSRAHRVCVALTLLAITSLGFMAGLHVYKSMYARRSWCGAMRIPLSHGIQPENTLIAANFQNTPDLDEVKKLNMFAMFDHEIANELVDQNRREQFQELAAVKTPNFEFDFEIDTEEEQFETFELPEIFLGRYMHDFKVNYTVIIDPLGQRCLLMRLDRSLIPAPRNVFDILSRMRSGEFDIDYEEIRRTYQISGPAVAQFGPSHGDFIPDACAAKTTFQLEELVGDLIVKRDVENTKYGEFVGSKLIKYNIVGGAK